MILDNIKTLYVWGDSILKGLVQNSSKDGADSKRYVLLRENGLSMAAERLGLEVINHSYFGSTIQKGERVIERDLSRGARCQAAIVEFGGNDCDYHWKSVADAPDSRHEPRTPLKKFIAELENVINRLKSAFIRPILMTLPPLVPERYFKTITEEADADIIQNWLGDIHFLYRWHELYSDEIAKTALRTDCSLIDMRLAFLEERNYRDLICEDGIHPNERGHKFMRDVFIKIAQRPA